ncbi:acyl carrier protein [Falsirhodobacter algicola]|uniref:Acyl carrier protein n=1 Tax=Falsirhodobacter algicola TaxID=2692330 RepID=A0A8J8MRJ6_9RHOB|nr:phosphopantetheine-binding protein [Falsirhodobacter algicola]QUS35420.1 acyl carrier protein [Falsirhodobacter algicola]
MNDIHQKVIAIIAHQAMLAPSDVTADSSPADLGIDSMGLVETIFAIEETFDIAVPFNANDPLSSGFDITSVGAIADAVDHLVAQKAA